MILPILKDQNLWNFDPGNGFAPAKFVENIFGKVGFKLSKNECPCHTSLVKNVIILFPSVNKLCGLSITGSSIGHKNIMWLCLLWPWCMEE